VPVEPEKADTEPPLDAPPEEAPAGSDRAEAEDGPAASTTH
jgi:hypothetical protein